MEQGTAFTRLRTKSTIASRDCAADTEGRPPQDLPLPNDVPAEG
jgi:hypothetical protein